jgi:hypothetical protein
LILATGPLAGPAGVGHRRPHRVTIGAGTNGPTSTQANGFFGTNLKYCGYDAIVIQGQAATGSTSTSTTTVSSRATPSPTSARTLADAAGAQRDLG